MSPPEVTGDGERGVQHGHVLDRQKMRRKMALLERVEWRRNGFGGCGCGSGDGERLPVTCARTLSFIDHPSPNPANRGEFFFFSSRFYKMILDDESDPFRYEVSLWRNYRDETFTFLPFMHT